MVTRSAFTSCAKKFDCAKINKVASSNFCGFIIPNKHQFSFWLHLTFRWRNVYFVFCKCTLVRRSSRSFLFLFQNHF